MAQQLSLALTLKRVRRYLIVIESPYPHPVRSHSAPPPGGSLDPTQDAMLARRDAPIFSNAKQSADFVRSAADTSYRAATSGSVVSGAIGVMREKTSRLAAKPQRKV